MIEIARRQTKSIEGMKKLRGIRQDQINKWGPAIVDSVEAGLALSNSECPQIPSGKPPHRSEVISSDFIYLLLKIFADELNLATEHLATRDEIQSLVRCKNSDLQNEQDHIRLTKGWRRQVAGQKIIDIIEGATVKLSISNHSSKPRALAIDISELDSN